MFNIKSLLIYGVIVIDNRQHILAHDLCSHELIYYVNIILFMIKLNMPTVKWTGIQAGVREL